ncbi:hypothetical protein PG994_007182 [Apiospora phragmitis]|uniref:Ankyrin repeat domain-containing protein n=1 Tax=Apiospora phragmitis TaxID=2905665 RepID=A0ABR1V022_9PEZI
MTIFFAVSGQSSAALPALALQHSDSPDLFRHLCDMLSAPETVTNDALVLTLVERRAGGVAMLRWMLDETKLDVNWVYHFDYPASAGRGDARERAQWDAALLRCERQKSATALHAAAINGNAEAVRFLLDCSASTEIRTGRGNTAQMLAEQREQGEVVEVFQQHPTRSRGLR